jgi:peptidoglycan/xylan/chitin deacetylase (PgdA/CDA1 family)
MIELFARDEYSALGIAAILDLERIPHRRIAALEEGGQGLLVVVAHDLSASEIAAVGRRTALVFAGGPRFARDTFGCDGARIEHRPCTLSLDEPVWSRRAREVGRSFGKSALRLPLAPICEASAIAPAPAVTMLAAAPIVARRGACTWCTIDVGAAFANLLTEAYVPHRPVRTAAPGFIAWARRVAEGIYYAAPDALRRRVQQRIYARLAQRLADDPARTSEYPIDATGWLLSELVRGLLKSAAGSLVRVARWPAPYRAAATLTHDVEPRRFAYTTGLTRLLDRIADTGHPATLGLVAGASARHLTDALVQRTAGHHVLCHGLEHRGEKVDGRETVATDLRDAHATLERRLGRSVRGYRSPRLDRSPDLAWALDRSAFRYDSSYPDVDRENMAHFGAGVRVNVPYRPPVEDDSGALRPSRCLELPLTAPDCIQPLLGGASVAELRATIETKAAFLRASEGLYVALVHGGVFGERDVALRGEHLDFVCRQLRHRDVWLGSMDEIVDWWTARESLQLSVDDGSVTVTNGGTQRIGGIRIVVERDSTEHVLDAPALAAGERTVLAIPRSTVLPAA